VPEITGCADRAAGDGMALHRLERGLAVRQHQQFRIILEGEDPVARTNDRGVGGLARARPQHLPRLRIEPKNWPAFLCVMPTSMSPLTTALVM
jgi:hypothetical protein